jgi:hypothetical protein
VTEDLTNKVVAWASEVAGYAAQLPSRQARDDYLRERRRELVTGAQAEGATPGDAAIVADACVDAARRIMTELDGSKNLVDRQHFCFHRVGWIRGKACGDSQGFSISMIG